MRDLVRNRQHIVERHLVSFDYRPDPDNPGRLTAEKEKQYSEPYEFWATITPPAGEYARNPFGSFRDYTHIMSAAHSRHLPVAEESILWFEGKAYKVLRFAPHVLDDDLWALGAVNASEYPNPLE